MIEVPFHEGQLISVEGFEYEVVNVVGNLMKAKCNGVCSEHPQEVKRKLKKGASFSCNAQRLMCYEAKAGRFFKLKFQPEGN